MSPVPQLWQDFFSLACALTAAEATVLWSCIPRQQQQQVLYQVDRVSRRKPVGPTSEREAMRFLQLLVPRELINACETAVQQGHVTRQDIVSIEEKVLAEMRSNGEWK